MKREEMIKKIINILYKADEWCEYDDKYEEVANEIINAIIPEDAVVLTKQQQEIIDSRILDTYLVGKSDGIKETAKDIYRELYLNSFKDEKMFYPTFENWAEVLRKYGVEVEE